MKRKKSLNKDILTLSILTLITVLSWIGFDIYRQIKKSTLSSDLKQKMADFNPTLDKKTLESLKERKVLTQEELDSVPELSTLTLPPKIASPSAIKDSSPSGQVILNEEK